MGDLVLSITRANQIPRDNTHQMVRYTRQCEHQIINPR